MPHDPNVEPFRPGETGIGADRLNEVVRPVNSTKREFNTRERVPLDYPDYPAACMIWVYADEVGRGKYRGIALHSPITCDSSESLPADVGTLYPTDGTTGQPWGIPCMVEDDAEAGDTDNSGHRITFGGGKHRLAGVFVGIDKTSTLPTYSVNFGRRTWKTRWNMGERKLEQSANWDAPTPSWELIVAFDPCGDSTPTSLASESDAATAAAASATSAPAGSLGSMLGGAHL